MMEFISAQFFLICHKWKEFFVTDTIEFLLLKVVKANCLNLRINSI